MSLAPLNPIQMLPARDRVAAALREAILSHQFAEGEELTLKDTAAQLGVSSTPIREAFQMLAREGLIELRPNRGAIVLGMNEKRLRDHYETRAALERARCGIGMPQKGRHCPRQAGLHTGSVRAGAE